MDISRKVFVSQTFVSVGMVKVQLMPVGSHLNLMKQSLHATGQIKLMNVCQLKHQRPLQTVHQQLHLKLIAMISVLIKILVIQYQMDAVRPNTAGVVEMGKVG